MKKKLQFNTQNIKNTINKHYTYENIRNRGEKK